MLSNTKTFLRTASLDVLGHEMAHRMLGAKDEYVTAHSQQRAPLRKPRTRRPRASLVQALRRSLMNSSATTSAQVRPVHYRTIANVIGRVTERRLDPVLLGAGQDGRQLPDFR